MIIEPLTGLFERDIEKLKGEIDLYRDEDNLGVINAGISNSAGNLCLHLIGNLSHFIGASLGNTGYVTYRDDEFSLKNIPRRNLVMKIENCKVIVKNTLVKLTAADLEKDFPLEKHGAIVSTAHMLLHLYGHLSYHLRQMNYHRRLLA